MSSKLSKTTWKRIIRKASIRILLANDMRTLCARMSDVYSVWNDIVARCVHKQTLKRAAILRKRLESFLIMCKQHKDNLIISQITDVGVASNEAISYQGLMAAFFSLYIDVALMSTDVIVTQKIMDIVRKLLSFLKEWPEKVADALLGITVNDDLDHGSTFRLLIWRVTDEYKGVKLTNTNYVKLAILIKRWSPLIQHFKEAETWGFLWKIPVPKGMEKFLRKKLAAQYPKSKSKKELNIKTVLKRLSTKSQTMLLKKMDKPFKRALAEIASLYRLHGLEDDEKENSRRGSDAAQLFNEACEGDRGSSKDEEDSHDDDGDLEISPCVPKEVIDGDLKNAEMISSLAAAVDAVSSSITDVLSVEESPGAIMDKAPIASDKIQSPVTSESAAKTDLAKNVDLPSSSAEQCPLQPVVIMERMQSLEELSTRPSDEEKSMDLSATDDHGDAGKAQVCLFATPDDPSANQQRLTLTPYNSNDSVLNNCVPDSTSSDRSPPRFTYGRLSRLKLHDKTRQMVLANVKDVPMVSNGSDAEPSSASLQHLTAVEGGNQTPNSTVKMGTYSSMTLETPSKRTVEKKIYDLRDSSKKKRYNLRSLMK